MGSSYFKNHLGFSLTDEAFEDIPYPATELVTHVTLKTVQSGALLGTTFFGPLYALARAPTRNLAGIAQKASRFGRNGVLIGLAMGPVITYAQGKNFKTEEFTDRDYRLRHNRGQVRVDRASFIGGAVGAGVSVAMGNCPILGGLVGISTGILGMAMYNSAAATEKPAKKSEENTKDISTEQLNK